MIYLLDTNAIVKILNNDRRVVENARRCRTRDIGIPAIAKYELYFGAHKGQRTDRTLNFIDSLAFETIAFDDGDARAAGRVRASLAAAGTPIGPYDVLIAGQALARGLIVVTHNTREFSRVDGLRLEDWEL